MTLEQYIHCIMIELGVCLISFSSKGYLDQSRTYT